MKKAILAIATIAILTVGNSFAQKGYRSNGHDGPGHESPVYSSARVDNAREEYSINKLDNIVKLSRKQENEIKKIENYYDKAAANSRRIQTLQSLKRLEEQKQEDILKVLTPNQRQKLFAYQRADKFDNRDRFGNNDKYNRRG